jgi:hypothetical protein
MTEDVFGFLVTPPQVEKAIENTLRAWSDTYLRRMEKASGRKPRAFPSIASYRAADTMEERFPEQQIPACQVMVATEIELVTRGESVVGIYKGDIDFLVQSTEPETARELALLYAWGHGLLLFQKSGLDESIPVCGLGWERAGSPATGKETGRWLAIGTVEITVEVQDVASPLEGPLEPTEGEPVDYPIVEGTELIVDGVAP